MQTEVYFLYSSIFGEKILLRKAGENILLRMRVTVRSCNDLAWVPEGSWRECPATDARYCPLVY